MTATLTGLKFSKDLSPFFLNADLISSAALCVLCVSAVNFKSMKKGLKFTAETQSTQRAAEKMFSADIGFMIVFLLCKNLS
jgi:hypothetical protein